MKGLLILENGARFEGDLLGSVEGLGELVFNTGMTGYQECFTDPSYEGQILTLTYRSSVTMARMIFSCRIESRQQQASSLTRSQSIRRTGNAKKRSPISSKDTMYPAFTMSIPVP